MGCQEFREHRRDRLDRDDARAGRAQAGQEFAGAGAEIDDVRVCIEAQRVAQPADDRGRIVGAAAHVVVGALRKAVCGAVQWHPCDIHGKVEKTITSLPPAGRCVLRAVWLKHDAPCCQTRDDTLDSNALIAANDVRFARHRQFHAGVVCRHQLGSSL